MPSRLLKRSEQTGKYTDMLARPENVENAPSYGGASAACIDVNGDGMYEIVVTSFTTGLYAELLLNKIIRL